MPYIDKESRLELLVEGREIQTPGELNYTITKLVHQYIRKFGRKYDTLNTVVGVLEAAKMELYREVVGPYEDVKKSENGPVSEIDK